MGLAALLVERVLLNSLEVKELPSDLASLIDDDKDPRRVDRSSDGAVDDDTETESTLPRFFFITKLASRFSFKNLAQNEGDGDEGLRLGFKLPSDLDSAPPDDELEPLLKKIKTSLKIS